MSQLGGSDVPVPIAIEHSEKLLELLLRVGRLGREQLRRDEFDQAVVVGVGLVD